MTGSAEPETRPLEQTWPDYGPSTNGRAPRRLRPATTLAGSSEPVATAVVQALATRAASGRDPLLPDGDDRPSIRGDARDRLLAVLLDDPVRTLAATLELEACTDRLATLSAAVAEERATLGGVLRKLSAAGLRRSQLAALAGIGEDDVTALVDAADRRR